MTAKRTRAQEASVAIDEAMLVLGRGIPMGAEIKHEATREGRHADKVLRVTISIVLENPDAEFYQ